MTRAACVVAIATLGAACGHAAPPPPPPTHIVPPDAGAAPDAAPVALEDDLPALAVRAVKLYQDWQAALAAAGDDCAAAAKALDALAERDADVIAANARVLHGPRERIQALRAELDKHGAELDVAAQSIAHAPAMTSCSGDAAFARATDRIGGEP
ncbi:MAG TPA: hypothetical protein VLX92_14490 [Kofleriaceae bacterium]|nr:hypothetical protein [Kofleriaceae bacterium]